MDTIFALASAAGKAGVAVVRVSGPHADDVCSALTRRAPPEPRIASVRRLFTDNGSMLDDALVLRFLAGASFTGEPVIEFQCHGSVAIISALLVTLSNLPNARLAEPGEFTRRALENGRLDVTQVDALSDLIEAETEAQRQQALKIFDGALGQIVGRWRSELVRLAALLQVSIDFADEDIPDHLIADARSGLRAILDEIEQQLSGYDSSERIRNGFEVAIVGPPNIGKSTLLNALAGREAALTHEIAGTTRDVIEVRMNIGGLPVTLLDTAGIRDTTDAVEVLGIEHGRHRASLSDLRVFLVEDLDGALPLSPQSDDLIKLGKADLSRDGRGVSGKTGAGLQCLLNEIESRLKERVQGASLLIRERHRNAMTVASASLREAIEMLRHGDDRIDVVSEELRIAMSAMDSLIGVVDVEDILDDVFGHFCLGK